MAARHAGVGKSARPRTGTGARGAGDVAQPKPAEDPIVVRQARLLRDLVDDLAAIDTGAQRLSPDAMRRMVSIGGRAARFVDKAFGRRSGS
ncbi:MAG: hypothetical protein KJ551_04385 [Alphaproteobacteria bacterium]|nr:hypothetical protein [Alphaproteobacteria bacterium]